jgi:dihydroorotate dehydrogenase (NAD+) catalytic subunit
MMVDLSVDLGFLKLRNPILTASGTFGYGLEFAPFMDLEALGGFVVKGLYYGPREGNPPPRLVETPSGLINAIGLQGIGVEAFAKKILPRLKNLDTAVIVNVCGETEEEYVQVVEFLGGMEGIAAFEINISCPNVRQGGACPALSPEATFQLVGAVRRASRIPIITKLSPNVTDIGAIAAAAERAGSDAISLVNTFLAMAIDIETRRPKLANVFGGLSGPAIRPIAVRMVHQAASRVRIPVIGMGGITSGADALEFLIAGARAVEIGTANFIDPDAPVRIIRELEEFCERRKIARIEDLIGTIALK